ncbi:hypothetical protein LZ32DRAFT_263092 [Colletotrichum eremochloae]|nr:hypothetical protein LZ32DRAFT_263092 [Colletotrichum eremochloae]
MSTPRQPTSTVSISGIIAALFLQAVIPSKQVQGGKERQLTTSVNKTQSALVPRYETWLSWTLSHDAKPTMAGEQSGPHPLSPPTRPFGVFKPPRLLLLLH